MEQTIDAMDHVLTLHRQSFPRVRRPPYPEPRYMTVAEVDRARQEALKVAFRGVPFWRLEERNRIRADVEVSVAAKMREHDRRSDEQVARARRDIDAWWAALLGGDPKTVLETVNEALSNNERPSAAVQVEGNELSVVFLVPGASDVPDRELTETASGQPTTKPLSKTRKNELRGLAALGHMIATAKEALAMAPSIQTVKVVGVERGASGSFDVLLASSYHRAALDAVDWEASDAEAVFRAAAEAASVLLVESGGRTSELQPLDLSDEPELRELVATLAEASREA